jgi:hypothetical protein
METWAYTSLEKPLKAMQEASLFHGKSKDHPVGLPRTLIAINPALWQRGREGERGK